MNNSEQDNKTFKSIKAKVESTRSVSQKAIDFLVNNLGSTFFLALNVVWFIIWIAINTGQIKQIPAFDPFPFSLLTTAVSLEAIILAILVLISQNRSLKIGDLREEIHLQVNLLAEQENTKTMKLLLLLLKKQGVDVTHDAELQKLIQPMNQEEIQEELEKEILS